MVNTQQKCGVEALDQLVSNHKALRAMTKNLQRRALDDSKEYAVLCHKMSLMYLHEAKNNPDALRRALRLAKSSVKLLRKYKGHKDVADWLRMGEIHLRMLASVKQEIRRIG